MDKERKLKSQMKNEAKREENRNKVLHDLNVDDEFLDLLEEGMQKYDEALNGLKDR